MMSKDCEFFKPTRESLLRFLTYGFNNGLSYTTLNTQRSAVSLLSTNKIGEDSLVSRFFKGIENLKPPKPKYSATWDVSLVLSYVKSLGSSNNLKLDELTLKTVILIALCTGQRIQTLEKIMISNIRFLDSGVQIKIPDLIKTSGKNRFQPLLLLPKYNDERLCVVTALQRYLEVTSDLRNTDKLFISTV